MPSSARRRYFELRHKGLKGAAAARQVGVSVSCGSNWFIDAGSMIIPDPPNCEYEVVPLRPVA